MKMAPNKKKFLIFIIFLFLFAYFIWPTPYRYEKIKWYGNIYIVRINRFTGQAYVLIPKLGWEPLFIKEKEKSKESYTISPSLWELIKKFPSKSGS